MKFVQDLSYLLCTSGLMMCLIALYNKVTQCISDFLIRLD